LVAARGADRGRFNAAKAFRHCEYECKPVGGRRFARLRRCVGVAVPSAPPCCPRSQKGRRPIMPRLSPPISKLVELYGRWRGPAPLGAAPILVERAKSYRLRGPAHGQVVQRHARAGIRARAVPAPALCWCTSTKHRPPVAGTSGLQGMRGSRMRQQAAGRPPPLLRLLAAAAAAAEQQRRRRSAGLINRWEAPAQQLVPGAASRQRSPLSPSVARQRHRARGPPPPAPPRAPSTRARPSSRRPRPRASQLQASKGPAPPHPPARACLARRLCACNLYSAEERQAFAQLKEQPAPAGGRACRCRRMQPPKRQPPPPPPAPTSRHQQGKLPSSSRLQACAPAWPQLAPAARQPLERPAPAAGTLTGCTAR
jgi:hypothetical protein